MIVKSHRHSTGTSSEEDEGIGKTVTGNATKIHMATDAFDLPLDFIITAGQVSDIKIAPELLSQLPTTGYVIADKGYDKEKFREQIKEKGAIHVCPRKRNSLIGNDDIDWGLYKYRHLVENVFARLKHFRAIATQYDKLKRNYRSMVTLACTFSWLPM